MFYYKSFYTDGTWAYIKSKKPIAPEDVCKTCIRLERKSALWYWRLRLVYGRP